jgi:hypothetical protein
MDPISLIISALVAGAAAGLKPTAEKVVRDAYEGFKKFLVGRFGNKSNIESLEEKPQSAGRQATVKEELEDAGAARDAELMERARQLIETIKTHAPADARAVGVNLSEVEAEFIKIGKVLSSGGGFVGSKLKLRGGLTIDEIQAGGNPPERQ